MGLIRFLIRLFILLAGAVLGVVLFFFAVIAFVTFLLFSLLTGKKPNLQFRVNKNPWAHRRPPSAEVGGVCVESRRGSILSATELSSARRSCARRSTSQS